MHSGRTSIAQSMQDAVEAASVVDGLLEPDDVGIVVFSVVLMGCLRVLDLDVPRVQIGRGKDQDKGNGRAGEKARLVEGHDVLEGQVIGSAEQMSQFGKDTYYGLGWSGLPFPQHPPPA